LAQLHRALERALRGQRQVVFVAGEPGIGKTALIDAFLAEAAGARQDLWVGRGQCIDHYGAGEAYLPMLEAFGGLARRMEEQGLISLLRRQASTWLVQMPALMEEAEREALSRQLYGSTQERMARELAGALETLTAERPLVLWLEDLHWSDFSTADALAMLARRREPARLLVVGTYRPADVIAGGHPLRALVRELEAHGQCKGLPLRFLTSPEVTQYLAQYLAARFALSEPQAAGLEAWGRFLHGRTDGNPLFMVAMVDDLIGQGVIGGAALERPWPAPPVSLAGGLPENLRQLIDHQLDRLSQEERGVLEAASVAGREFLAASVAAALDTDVFMVEGCCDALASRHLFLDSGKGPTGPERRLCERYRFLHALYPQILYERLPASRRRQLHQAVGESKETAFGSRSADIAAELAVHFEEARDHARAVHYLGQAGENALRRSGHREAIEHLTKGLELLKFLPETPERTRQELLLQIALGSTLMATKGYAAPEVERAYARARELCQQVEETLQQFQVLWGLWQYHIVRAELQSAYELAEQFLAVAQRVQDPAFLVRAYHALGDTLLHLGEMAPARTHLEQGIALYEPRQHRSLAFLYGGDPGVACLDFAAWALWFLDYPDQALQRSHEAVALAEELSYPHFKAFALFFSAWLHHFRREPEAARERTETLLALTREHGFSFWSSIATMVHGWALAVQGQAEDGIAEIRSAVIAFRATGARMQAPNYSAMLAEACGQAGQTEEGLSILAEALAEVEKTGERYYEAEFYRLRGELTLKQSRGRSPESEAEECFRKAIEIARRQSAKSLELRAVVSLSRLWQRQGKRQEARQRLAEIYGWFTEGFDTQDLQEARALLEEWA
jgi:predicted ATPase